MKDEDKQRAVTIEELIYWENSGIPPRSCISQGVDAPTPEEQQTDQSGLDAESDEYWSSIKKGVTALSLPYRLPDAEKFSSDCHLLRLKWTVGEADANTIVSTGMSSEFFFLFCDILSGLMFFTDQSKPPLRFAEKEKNYSPLLEFPFGVCDLPEQFICKPSFYATTYNPWACFAVRDGNDTSYYYFISSRHAHDLWGIPDVTNPVSKADKTAVRLFASMIKKMHFWIDRGCDLLQFHREEELKDDLYPKIAGYADIYWEGEEAEHRHNQAYRDEEKSHIPEPVDNADQNGPASEPNAIPSKLAEGEIEKLTLEEEQADDSGQDEELAKIVSQITKIKNGPSPEETAAMILKARPFSWEGNYKTKDEKRDHFWYLLYEAGLGPAAVRDVWNDGLNIQLRESLGDHRKQDGDGAWERIRGAINRHRDRIENTKQEAKS